MRKIVSPDGMRWCSGCKQFKPATSEYFHGKKKLERYCKECRHAKHAANPEPARQRAKVSWDKLKDGVNAERRNKRKENPEHFRKIEQDWKENNRDKYLASKRKYYLGHRDYVLAQQKESKLRRGVNRKDYARKYYILNTDKVKASAKATKHKRRAIERQLGCQFTANDWNRCLEYWDYKCAVCGQSASMWVTLAADHWIPIADKSDNNPGTVVWNIIPLCHGKKGIPIGTTCCNQLKGKKDPIEWLIEWLGKRKAKIKLAEIEAYFISVKPK